MSLLKKDTAAAVAALYGPMWQEIEEHYRAKLESARDELETCDPKDSARIGKIQGQIEEIREFLSLAANSQKVLKLQTR